MDSVTITLPLPDPRLGPNKPAATRGSMLAKARLTKAYRRSAYFRTLEAMPTVFDTPWPRAKATLDFYFNDSRRRDIRNLEAAMKAAYDGIVEAGLITDDRHEVLSHGMTEVHKSGTDGPRVEITIERVDDDTNQDR